MSFAKIRYCCVWWYVVLCRFRFGTNRCPLLPRVKKRRRAIGLGSCSASVWFETPYRD